MYIIVGLGNPGRRYEATRHNIGFITADCIARALNIKIDKLKFKALIGEGFFAGEKVILVKPQTYMNLSGESVREIVNFYRLDLSNLIVIYDDIDITAGSIRIRKGGSAGTHNGMRNIIYHLYDDAFPRVRIGIGNPGSMDLADFVTRGIQKEEVSIFEEAVDKAVKAALTIVEHGTDRAMNEYNVKEKKVKDDTETD